METFDQMIERHRWEMGELMQAQVYSWKDLIAQYDNDSNKIPIDVYQQWYEQYASPRRDSLLAQHAAEREAYPDNPLDPNHQTSPGQGVNYQPRWLQSLHDRVPDPGFADKEKTKDADIDPGKD